MQEWARTSARNCKRQRTTEEWTLDTTFPNNNATNLNLNVQPWKFVEKKTFTSLAQLKEQCILT